jgi:hypothetical protein
MMLNVRCRLQSSCLLAVMELRYGQCGWLDPRPRPRRRSTAWCGRPIPNKCVTPGIPRAPASTRSHAMTRPERNYSNVPCCAAQVWMERRITGQGATKSADGWSECFHAVLPKLTMKRHVDATASSEYCLSALRYTASKTGLPTRGPATHGRGSFILAWMPSIPV